jgi:hypothetical protein
MVAEILLWESTNALLLIPVVQPLLHRQTALTILWWRFFDWWLFGRWLFNRRLGLVFIWWWFGWLFGVVRRVHGG